MRGWNQILERVEPDCWDGGARRLRGWSQMGKGQRCERGRARFGRGKGQRWERGRARVVREEGPEVVEGLLP